MVVGGGVVTVPSEEEVTAIAVVVVTFAVPSASGGDEAAAATGTGPGTVADAVDVEKEDRMVAGVAVEGIVAASTGTSSEEQSSAWDNVVGGGSVVIAMVLLLLLLLLHKKYVLYIYMCVVSRRRRLRRVLGVCTFDSTTTGLYRYSQRDTAPKPRLAGAFLRRILRPRSCSNCPDGFDNIVQLYVHAIQYYSQIGRTKI